jgi:uncharacterized protein
MTARVHDCFADTAFWFGLVVKQDQYHQRAREWSAAVEGRIKTTIAVMLETANLLSRPAWRGSCIGLFKRLEETEVEVIPLSMDLWQRGWELFQNRLDKAWSMTDCVSFVVMKERNLTDALTTDADFQQAGFRALLLEEP